MTEDKTISKRDGKGRFAQGHSGNPAGRPVGAETRALRELREWTANKGLPLLIKKAEAGDLDALKMLFIDDMRVIFVFQGVFAAHFYEFLLQSLEKGGFYTLLYEQIVGRNARLTAV